MEEVGGLAGCEDTPEDGLAAETKTDAEASDRESEEEGPLLIFWEENVFRLLQQNNNYHVHWMLLAA